MGVQGIAVPTPIYEFFEEGSSCFRSPRRNAFARLLLRLAEADPRGAEQLLEGFKAEQALSEVSLSLHRGPFS